VVLFTVQLLWAFLGSKLHQMNEELDKEVFGVD